MLHNIDIDQLSAVKSRDPEAAQIIDTLLENHKQILSTISHEIRNPLTLVYSSLQMIASTHPEVHDFKFWDSAYEDVEYIKQLLEELSTFNNSQVLSLTTLDSTILFRRAALSFAISVEDTDIHFVSNIPSGLPFILGHQNKLLEVCLNILRNAQEAISETGNISFVVTHDTDTNELVITISNDGELIPEEQLPTIFDLFTTYKKGGTGLGLAICNTIIEAHHGTITATSTTLDGTAFHIRLPIQ